MPPGGTSLECNRDKTGTSKAACSAVPQITLFVLALIPLQYPQQGKEILNKYGRIALLDGSYPSHNIPGKNMHK